jgi:leader peptidase (prepilin peptidase)/N-methyltransferase
MFNLMPLFELLQSAPGLFIAACTLLGLVVGSFLNVVIYRLPQMMEREWRAQCAELAGTPAPAPEPVLNLVVPRSFCPACKHTLSAVENIPVLSYLVLRGRCAHCRTPVSLRYPLVEAMAGILSALVAWKFGFSLAAAGALIFVWALLVLAFIDLDTQLLPDSITLPLLWAGLLFNALGAFTSLKLAVMGAAAGYLFLWAVYWAFKLATGKEGIGYGDFKLLAAIGAWLGWPQLPFVILIGSLAGAIVGLGLMVFAKHGRSSPIPFGPYLAGGGLVGLFWGKAIVHAYIAGL